MTEPISIVLPAIEQSVARARQFVEGVYDLAGLGCADLAKQAVSELFTNVIKHTGTAKATVSVHTDLTVAIEDGRQIKGVRLEVFDTSPRRPVVASMDDWAAESGRGLAMLVLMAAGWGVTQLGCGKAVWVDLPLELAAPAPA